MFKGLSVCEKIKIWWKTADTRFNLSTSFCFYLKFLSAIFLSFTKWYLLKNYEKIILISSKKLFWSKHIQIFVFPSCPYFLSVNQLEKVIEDKSWSLWHHQLAKQEFKNILFDIVRRKVGFILKLSHLISSIK